jgi:hypothetical protein
MHHLRLRALRLERARLRSRAPLLRRAFPLLRLVRSLRCRRPLLLHLRPPRAAPPAKSAPRAPRPARTRAPRPARTCPRNR